MFTRLSNTAQSLAYLALTYVSWKWFTGALDWTFSVACVSLSALWLALTYLDSRELFRNYFDVLSRIKVILPLIFGLVLSSLALLAPIHSSETAIHMDVVSSASLLLSPLKIFALAEMLAWALLYARYRHNKSLYKTQGHGPLPVNAWVNPDPAALQPGDLILTSGRVAKTLHETVGHGEMVVQMETNGKLATWSSFMDKGAVVQSLTDVAASNSKYGHYVVMRLSTPLDDEQKRITPALVAIMLRQNAQWKAVAQAARKARFARFHLPGFLCRLIEKKLPLNGYDWWGLFSGRVAQDHWTCIGACLELANRLGVKTNRYGTGLLGLGTGLFDPIMPVRFLGDPAFHLLNLSDKQAFEKVATKNLKLRTKNWDPERSSPLTLE